MAMQSVPEWGCRIHLPVDATPLLSQSEVDAREAWESLLGGRWAVDDHFKGAPIRTIVARSVDAHARRDALEADELRVAMLRARGLSIKVLAGELGWTFGAVCKRVASAMRKLRLTSLANLVALFQERPPRGLQASRMQAGDLELVTFSYPAPFWALPPCLTRAEQGVVLEMLRGTCQRDIARARGTSPRTVANQVASIFRKLGVGSRIELFVALGRPRLSES